MVRRTIRAKLLAGLSLVVGMMLTLLFGSMFGLNAFHTSNLTLTNQLRELGASVSLLHYVAGINARGALTDPAERDALEADVRRAQQSLLDYYKQLKANTFRERVDDGRDELELAFLIDDDLASILGVLHNRPAQPILPGTAVHLAQNAHHRSVDLNPLDRLSMLEGRVQSVNKRVMDLPRVLHKDFYAVLQHSQGQYQSSRLLVWTAAVAVVAMLCGLAALVRRWVLYPLRLLQRGVRRVARGYFDYTIDLKTGDEMQALAEAFNHMTSRLSVTYADLERQVEERSRQLVRSERLAGVGFLAAGVAHEINNPLASIAFCAEALERRFEPTGEAEDPQAQVVRSYLRMIQEEAFRCKRITERLLDFARCGEIRREPADLAELVGAVVEMVQHIGKYREKSIEVIAPEDRSEAVVAEVDAQEIKQVVLNLVVNALDCMEPGGTLQVELGHSEGFVEMVFRDDGCGMTPDVLENIFEPFYTRRKDGKGTGLGLSISHRIVSQHQGEIMAASQGEGRGSTFTVRLPAVPPTDLSHRPIPADPPEATTTQRAA